MKLNQKNLGGVMEDLYEVDKESYDELWHSLQVLNNLGLVDDNLMKFAVKKDHTLWNIENMEND